MNLSTWSIRNPIPTILFFLLLSLAGVWGFKTLGVQDFPDLDLPAVSVQLKLPGAAPAQMETEVAKKVEDKIATVPGLRHISTSITDGEVNINVQFAIGTALSDALLDVKDAVDGVRGDLPADLEEPVVSKVKVGPGGPTLTYAVTSTAMDEEALSWFTDDQLARAMLAVPGVGRFARVGGVQREVQVQVQPQLLAALGVTALDVSRALKQVQQDASGGRGQLGGNEQGMRTIATVQRAEDLRALPIALADGRAVRLDQVAEVRDTVAERSQAALLDGKPAVGFQVTRSRGADEITIETGVKRAIATLEAQNPGLNFQLVSSTVEHTREQYHGSMTMLYEGAILAVLVIWWFLRDWRATIIGAAALPLSILPTFAFMAWAGYALNTITLLALAVVVGILVDDAIVEIENIARHGRMGKPIREATEEAVNEIWLAVLATTAALVVVFLPTAFMSGVPGLVFKQFGWTVVISVLASLVVARMATPLMSVWLLKDHPAQAGDGALMRGYMRCAAWCMHHRGLTIIATLMLFIGSVALVPLLPRGFIPPSDVGKTTVNIELPPGTPLATTLATAEDARRAISGIAGVRSIFVTVGDAQAAGAPGGAGSVGEVRKASLTAILEERGTRPRQQEIENQMRPRLQAVAGMRWSISGGGPGEKLQIVLASADGAALKSSAQAMERELRALPYLSGVNSTASLERPEFTVHPDAARAAERGVTTQAIGETLRVATSGDFSSSLAKLNLDARQLDIRVRMPDALRHDQQALASLRVPGREGLVPLDSVATVSLDSGPSQIDRYDRNRNVTLTADLGGYSLDAALKQAKALPAVQALPASVRLIESGDAEIMVELFAGFGLALVVGVLCKYCVLVLLYKDWFHPFTNLSVLPLCVGGAFVALLAFGGQLSLPSLIGIVMLFGIVTKNAILIVDYALMAMRDHGLSEPDALLDACHKRARPVLMTTVAMVAGMLPMAFGWGGDASFRQPMAIAVIGGLITSTALSLIVVPVVFTYVSAIERALRPALHRPPRTASVIAAEGRS
jgi:multidrug efflux pump subunit AcrB